MQIKSGDKVQWRYKHFNRNSSVVITQTGTFLGLIKHTEKYKGLQLAKVLFDGNKYPSKIATFFLQKL